MSERRYSDDEMAALFMAAVELQQATSAAPTGGALAQGTNEGMTLAQLQEIGREVGIPSDLVARAAQGLDRRGRATVRRFLGLPIGVGRTVSLQRTLTEEEWQRLVVDLRETFDARGRLRDEGPFRQWTNGNLQALLEPTATGHQLRLRTVKGDAYRTMTIGIATAAFSGILFAMRLLTGHADTTAVVALAASGIAMFGLGAAIVPRWARERQKQMEDIAARLTASTSG
jgi:hypothetical protein